MAFPNMKYLPLLLATAITGAICPPSAIAQIDQNDNRPPIAKINPQKPIQIRVINQANEQIIAVLTEPASNDRAIAPQQFVTFGILHTSYLPLPINLIIYTERNSKNLNMALEAVGNEVIVRVNGQREIAGVTSAVHINPAGNIFLY